MSVNRQKGFAAYYLLVAVLILGIVGAVGWYVADKQRPKPNTTTASAQKADQPAKGTAQQLTKEIEIPDDWQWFVSSDGGTKFAYPKTWGTLTQIDKAEAPGYYDNNSFIRPVVITNKADFLTQLRKGYYDTTWYLWDSGANGLMSAVDEKEKARTTPSMDYTKPIGLGIPKAEEPYIFSGQNKHPIYFVLGKGAMNCGGRNYIFAIKDKVVLMNATLCDRGGEWEPQAGQQYTDVVEGPLKDLFNYVEE